MEILIIFCLIILNGLFAMTEIALVSSKRMKLESQVKKGDKKALAAIKLLDHPDQFFSTAQIGITLIGILMGIFSGEGIKDQAYQFIVQWAFLRPYANTLAVTLVVLIITFFSLVLGELVPKRIGLANPERIASLMAKPMHGLSRITYPFIWLLSGSTTVIIKILNIRTAENPVTEEEIKAMIHEGTTSGTIKEDEREIIERVFHLSDRSITSLMTHRTDIAWIDITDDPNQIRKKIKADLHSVYPVCEGQIDELIGVLQTKDLYLAPADMPLQQLIKKPLFIPENNSAYQVLEKFKVTKNHFGFIVDEYGSFLGMITLKDILEAIVGDMPESGEQDYEIIKRKDGTFLVDAQIPFYDFLSYFEKEEWIIDEEQQEFDTLAGFILHHLEHIPQEGEMVHWRGFTFEIVDMDGYRIDKILVILHPNLDVENPGEE